MVLRCIKGIWKYIKRVDILLWLIVAAISAYSLVLLRSVDSAVGSSYFRTRVFAIALGVAGAIVISLLDYGELANFWYLLAGFSVFLMIYTAIFGEAVQGSGGVNARAWINIAGRTFQSSELVKIFFCLTFGKHLDTLRKKGLIDNPLHVVLLGCHALVPMLLCELQGDTGAAVVFFAMFVVMSLAARVKLRYFAVLGGLVLIAIPILWQFVMDEYQKARIVALFNLDNVEVQANEGYQQYQGMISIGSGKFSGQGLFQGSRVASNSVPFQQSDYIFSVAGEELGFIGCSLILLLLLKLLRFTVKMGFSVSGTGILVTTLLFAAIFVLILLKNPVSNQSFQAGRAAAQRCSRRTGTQNQVDYRDSRRAHAGQRLYHRQCGKIAP